MASGALFAPSGGGRTGGGRSGNLVEFRAGKMHLRGKSVQPDNRKGLFYMHQSDDGIIHLCWKDRVSGNVEDDLMIFPDDCEFKRVAQCTTGRVYLLKYKATSKKLFFWMQEPKTDKDDEFCRKVNEIINNPPSQGSSGGSIAGRGGLPADFPGNDLQSILGSMSQQELMQLLGSVGGGGLGDLSNLLGGRTSSASQSETAPTSRSARAGATAVQAPTSQPPAAATTTSGAKQPSPPSSGSVTPTIQLSDLQNILSGFGSAGTPPPSKAELDLASAITPDAIIPILANPQIQERLLPFLPEGEALPKTEEELRETVASPQFRQAVSSFGAALSSGQLGPLMGQFGLGSSVVNAANQGDIEAFAKALQEASAKKEEAKKEEAKK